MHSTGIAVVDAEVGTKISIAPKVMTEAAKFKVRELYLLNKKQKQRICASGMECGNPALMLPSTKPLHYSFVSQSSYMPQSFRKIDIIQVVVFSVSTAERSNLLVCRVSGWSVCSD
jgi:hypothetical protein